MLVDTDVCRVQFINPYTKFVDETEFDTWDVDEVKDLFSMFCKENTFGKPKVIDMQFTTVREEAWE